MSTLTFNRLLAHLRQLGLRHELIIEDDSLILTITSPDYTTGKWAHGPHGDELLQRGTGWELEIAIPLTPEDVLSGLGDKQALTAEPFLEYRSYQYMWPDAAAVERDLTLDDMVDLLATLQRGEFPSAFFDEELAEL